MKPLEYLIMRQIGFKRNRDIVKSEPVEIETDNPFVKQMYKAFGEFLTEETNGLVCADRRLLGKIKMIRTLFAEEKDIIIDSKINNRRSLARSSNY